MLANYMVAVYIGEHIRIHFICPNLARREHSSAGNYAVERFNRYIPFFKRIQHAFLAEIKLIYGAKEFRGVLLVVLYARAEKLLFPIKHGNFC